MTPMEYAGAALAGFTLAGIVVIALRFLDDDDQDRCA